MAGGCDKTSISNKSRIMARFLFSPICIILATMANLVYSAVSKHVGLEPFFRVAEPRSLVGFYRVTLCVTRRNPYDYVNYGCYCGWGGSGTPVDPIDQCCKVHDDCYGKCEAKGCWPKLSPYTFKCNYFEKTAVCDTSINSECESCVCACDVNAANCFKQNDGYYHGKLSCKS